MRNFEVNFVLVYERQTGRLAMLKISAEQMKAFSAERREDFKQRLVQHLRKHHADDTAPYRDSQMLDYADKCIERAKQYGLTTERAVACYSQLHWVLGRDFEANRRCRFVVNILHDKKKDQNDRAKIAVAVAYKYRSLNNL